MKLLMIVGSADSIFVYNIAKWLKKKMDISIDIYELEPTKSNIYNNTYYSSINSNKLPYSNLKILQSTINFFSPIIKAYQIKSFLNEKHYDIIHIHWITNSIVTINNLHKYCKKLCITFWGGEITHQKIFKSHKLYLFLLKCFIKIVDNIVNSHQFLVKLEKQIPNISNKFHYATFGSSSIDYIIELMNNTTKEDTKFELKMPTNKIVVMIGYSGKPLHQHLSIIKAFKKSNNLKNKIHIFSPMTRDGDSAYIHEVETALIDSGYSYTLLKNKYLSDKEVAKIRLATDIVFQFSTFDGFSRSIIECICAKSLLLYAEWLDYKEALSEFDFEAISSPSIEDGITKLEEITSNFSDYNNIIETNARIGQKKLLWSECINDWINLYQNF